MVIFQQDKPALRDPQPHAGKEQLLKNMVIQIIRISSYSGVDDPFVEADELFYQA